MAVCVHMFVRSACLPDSANATLCEHTDQRSLAMNINSAFIASYYPDAPSDIKANQLSVCVSVYHEAVHGSKEGASVLHPPSLLPQGHRHTL